MNRRSYVLAQIIATADARAGLITAAQLAEHGVSASTVSRRVAGGMWTRVLPGVHLVGGGQPTRHQRVYATLLYAGPPSVLTGFSGVRAHGFRSLRLQEATTDEAERPAPVHVLIPHDRRRISTGFARIERTHRLPAPVRIDGIDVAPPARALADAARRCMRASDAVALVTEGVQRGLVTVSDLEVELRDGQRRGSAFLRDAVRAVTSGAHSVPEADLGALLRAAGIGDCLFNVVLVTDSGEYVAQPDVWMDDVGLALEVDSVEHHATRDGYERTIRRNARYAAAGVTPVTLLRTDIRDRPSWVVALIRRAREAAARRPRPQVQVTGSEPRSAGLVAWRWGA